MKNHVTTIDITSEEKWKALGIFNLNAFSSSLKPIAMACAERLALISYSIRMIRETMDENLCKLIRELHHNPAFKGYTPDPQRPVRVVYRDNDFQAGIQSFFVTVKSMLDVYSQVVTTAFMGKFTSFSFGKKEFKDKGKIPGGKLLNFLERNVAQSDAGTAGKLISILVSHIEDWIIDAVGRRDAIVHYGILKDIIPMHVLLLKDVHEIAYDDIILPSIKGKGNIVDYCQGLWKNIDSLLKETLVLLPDVDTKLLVL